MATKFVQTFFNDMPSTDYFGYINLGKQQTQHEIALEPKSKNTFTKQKLLDATLPKNDFLFQD